MNPLLSVGALGLAAALAVNAVSFERSGAHSAGKAPDETGAAENRFRLVAADKACILSKQRAQPGKVARLDADSDCRAVAPSLAAARGWLERDDGTVALVDAKAETLVLLAPADGAAYETFEAGSPLLSLVPAD